MASAEWPAEVDHSFVIALCEIPSGFRQTARQLFGFRKLLISILGRYRLPCLLYCIDDLVEGGGYDLQEINLSLSYRIVSPFVFESLDLLLN